MARFKGGDDFTESNSIISKFAFLLLVLIAFMFLLSLGIRLLAYFLAPPTTTVLVSGMIAGNSSQIITQDPNDKNSITIWRSSNQTTGIEFTWMFWLNISKIGNGGSNWQHIFNKGGNGNYTNNAFLAGAAISNAPGIYIHPSENTIRVLMDQEVTSINNNPSYVDITNVPLKKWFHVAIRLENTMLDVYINGTISGRVQMSSLPRQNYDNVYICSGATGGFSGFLSSLIYLNYATDVFKINSIVSAGPNTYSSQNLTLTNTDYLSNEWYNSKI